MKLGSCSCALIDSINKKFLLQLRDSSTNYCPNEYGFFGGKIEQGETFEECMKRELKEELEYNATNLKLVLNTKDGNLDRCTFVEEFDFFQKTNQHEGSGKKWFTYDEIINEEKINIERKERLVKVAKYLGWI